MVTWTNHAKEQIAEIHSYISRDSRLYAARMVKRITDNIQRLEMLPQIGRIVADFDDNSLREIFVSPYRIVYQTIEDNVVILAIVHSKQNLGEDVIN